METLRQLRDLGRSWLIVLLGLVIGGAAGYAIYHETTPMYRTTAQMIVSGGTTGSPAEESAARTLAIQRAAALAELAPSAPAVQAAAVAAGYPGVTPKVTARAAENQVAVTVTDKSAVRAQAIANQFASTLPVTLSQLESGGGTPIVATNLSLPEVPSKAFSPDRNRDIVLGLAIGLGIGLIVAGLRELLRRTVRDSDALERLTELTVLGTIPRDLPKKLLPAVTDPRSARAEAYRQVRTTLLNLPIRRLRTIAVTSAMLGEGKTSVAANLAAVFSRAGHKVALVDADLRRPQVAAYYGLKPQHGLTEVLSGMVLLRDAVTILEGGRLAVLTSGRIPANPSEALGSVGMEQVLAALLDEFEYVIVDTPPVLPVTDAAVLAPKLDGVILVARLEHTTRDRIRRAKSALERVGATILGVVPNQAGRGTDRDYRYPYRYTVDSKPGSAAAAPAPPPPPPAAPDQASPMRPEAPAHRAPAAPAAQPAQPAQPAPAAVYTPPRTPPATRPAGAPPGPPPAATPASPPPTSPPPTSPPPTETTGPARYVPPAQPQSQPPQSQPQRPAAPATDYAPTMPPTGSPVRGGPFRRHGPPGSR